MAGISNVNIPSQYSGSKAVRKLSFEIGEVFSARIVDDNNAHGDIVLKLNNGWKFSAKLTNNINYNVNSLSKFIVEGYEDGKIKIKMMPADDSSNSKTINSQQDILKDYINNNESEEDYSILKSLLNHNIPLTKENIQNVKSIMKFKDSIIENPIKAEEFINQYMDKNSIDKNSEKGKEAKKLLESFFKGLKGINPEELASFIENGIEVNGDNIKSFNKLFKQDSVIYKELGSIKETLNKLMENNGNKQMNSNLNKALSNKLNKDVINEIKSKINEMKDTIKDLISKGNLNGESFEKILSIVGNNINDMKLFNLISEGYYYLDVPLNFKNNNYDFKLILKDDRKSGKKIDSKNVKLIASIKTINMGIIDTFITINNKNLNIDIKSEEKWTKLLELAKVNLSNKIANMGYIVNLKVKPKESEVDIVSCRSFFNNEYTSNLDRRV
ncbi:hypothetical protein [Clostridium arbusti]|uniref:hypothetical protein n=1 Tax=Clostridium arbusti TaxID=1137848 RepID=UPI0002882BDE|nr:hypothetical protein [Clostridium arbusti]